MDAPGARSDETAVSKAPSIANCEWAICALQFAKRANHTVIAKYEIVIQVDLRFGAYFCSKPKKIYNAYHNLRREYSSEAFS